MDEVVDILVTTYNTNEKQKPLQKIEIFSKKFFNIRINIHYKNIPQSNFCGI